MTVVATSSATLGSSVVPSMHSVELLGFALGSPSDDRPARMPFSPVYTSCTCGEEGSMVTIVEASCATPAGEDAGTMDLPGKRDVLAVRKRVTLCSQPERQHSTAKRSQPCLR